MSIEDRVRTATEATAATVRQIRPLTLPDPDPARRHGFRSPRPGRAWGDWPIPLASAMAVIAVAATLVAVRSLTAAGSGSRSTPATTSVSATSASSGVPQYFVEVNDGSGTSVRGVPKGDAFVGDTSTGRPLAVFKPPGGFVYDVVAGSSDDRTFVLEAVPSAGLPWEESREIWYVLRLTPGAAHPARLTRVPVAASLTEGYLEGAAVSPDGRTLAVLAQPTREGAGGLPVVMAKGGATLRTFSLATGRVLRTWTAPAADSSLSGFADLSWLDDGDTLAFAYTSTPKDRDVRTLNVTSAGGNLMAGSRAVFAVPAGHTCNDSLLMTADGTSVICGVFGPNSGWCATGQVAFNVYSVATGKLERVLYRYPGDCESATASVLWAKSATLAIGSIAIAKPGAPFTTLLGVATPGTFTSLSNVPVGTLDTEIAF